MWKLFVLTSVLSFSLLAHDGGPLGQSGRRAANGPRLTARQDYFLSKIFPTVGIRTIERRYSGALRAAVESNPTDDAKLAREVAELMNTLDGREGVESLTREVTEERDRELNSAVESEIADQKWVTLLNRFLAAAQRLSGTIPTDSDESRKFSDEFKREFTEIDNQMKAVRDAVDRGDSGFLRDPKNLDHAALTHYLATAKNREFAGRLAQRLAWDNHLYLSDDQGKIVGFDLGGDVGKALEALSSVSGTDTARVATRRSPPTKTWYFDGTWREGTRPGQAPLEQVVDPNLISTVKAILRENCLTCHRQQLLDQWNPSTVLMAVTGQLTKVRNGRTIQIPRMPKDGEELSPADIAKIREWAQKSGK